MNDMVNISFNVSMNDLAIAEQVLTSFLEAVKSAKSQGAKPPTIPDEAGLQDEMNKEFNYSK